MKRRIIMLFISLIVIIASLGLVSCNKEGETTNGPKLIFSDDFDTLDASVWNVYTKTTDEDPGFGYDAILNDGMRKGGYWDKNQVFTKDGNLVIRTSLIDGKYYTGAIDTDNKWEKHYGYYEAKVLVPKASGMWAAFWLFCDEMGGPSTDASVVGTELDIFESPFYMHNASIPVSYQSAYHIGDYGDHYINYSSYIEHLLGKVKPANIYDTWHTFGMDWTENGYDFYLDGELMWSPKMDGNVSSKDSFLFLSCEIDGANGNASQTIFQVGTESINKNPEGTFATSQTQEGSYCSDFLVDYVKVWECNPYK